MEDQRRPTKDQKNQELLKMRHSAEHVLTQAMKELGFNFLMAMGPATDKGFYFDFELVGGEVSESDFSEIERKMREIVTRDRPITKQEVTVAQARKLFRNNPYKQEWLDEIQKSGKKAVIYWTGDPGGKDSFVDLCEGPHVKSTGKIGAVKLLSVAGAYWRGDEKNKMLTRIYGTAFPTEKELNQRLTNLEAAKKRDHRQLGRELDLFVIDQDIGKGLPLLTPKGTVIRDAILDYERELEEKYGFQRVTTPHIASTKIYQKTGHLKHYRETMYAPLGIDGEEYVLKPMNCPHHYAIYASRPRSYRDLPVRLSEAGVCYRYEKTGELLGLTRVRALTIDDAHILMTPEQVDQELTLCVKMIKEMLKALGVYRATKVRLSLSDPSEAVRYIADPETWKRAGEILEENIRANKLDYFTATGEASFYGPKIDFLIRDSLDREWQMSTVQLDLFMAKRLDLFFTDKRGAKQHPVIIHRGLTGSIERTIGFLIEHFGGALPTWLSPVQAAVLPVAKGSVQYAKEVNQRLLEEGIRTSIDETRGTVALKVLQAEKKKVPYILVVGPKEKKTQSVAVRVRGKQGIESVRLDSFIKLIKQEIEGKK